MDRMSSSPAAHGCATRARAAAVAGLLLLVALLCGLAAAPAAVAATTDVVLTDAAPSTVTITQGDSVVFVNGEDLAEHRVTSAQSGGSRPWQYDSGALRPGRASAPATFPEPGTYVFRDVRTVLVGGAERFARIVVQPAPAPAGRPRQAGCLLYTSPSPRDRTRSRMPSSA